VDKKHETAEVSKGTGKAIVAPGPKDPRTGAQATRPIAPAPVGPVDLHKMTNENDPTFDYTRNRQRPIEEVDPEAKAKSEEEEAQEVEKAFSDASDEELGRILLEEHPEAAPTKARSGKKSRSAKSGDEENDGPKRMKGAVALSGPFGGLSIPWETILSMLKATGLPLVKASIVKLRDRIAATSWPFWIKGPIVAALDQIIANPDLFATFQRNAKAIEG
jgi:hypothetical protein